MSMSNDLNHTALLDLANPIPDSGRPQILLHQDGDAASANSLSSVEADDVDLFDSGDFDKKDSASVVDHHVDAAPDQVKRSTKGSTRRRIKSIGHGAKEKSRHALSSVKTRIGISKPTPDDSPYADLDNNPAFDPSHLAGDKSLTEGGAADKILSAAHTVGRVIKDPRNIVKKTAASKMAVQDRPYLSQGADIEYLDAYADLSQAQTSHEDTSNDEDISSSDMDAMQQKVDHLENVREGRKVAWMTSRHIHRVMVVPKRIPTPPNKEEFYAQDPETGKLVFDRQGYFFAYTRYNLKSFALNQMGEVDPAGCEPFNKDFMLRVAERILIASSPWQIWILNLRSIYRWEKPRKTAIWFGVWFVVWWSDHMMTFILSWVVYIVLDNKFNKKGVESLRNSHDRGANDESAFKLTELIHRHGIQNWLDPMMEEVGPRVQMQLTDLADFLEILHNFYDWKVPKKTWSTLFWFMCAILLGILTDTGYAMKIIWMFCLLSFFLGRPIASKHPHYRHTVNALKWIFWDIPTDADLAMMYLRRKAQETRARLIGDATERKYNAETSANPGPTEVVAATIAISGPTSTHPISEPDSQSSDSESDISYHTASSSSGPALSDTDLVSFRCRNHAVQGRLIIHSDGIRFTRSSPFAAQRKEYFRHSWPSLVEMRKTAPSTLAKLRSSRGLELVVRVSGRSNTEVIKLENVTGRDRAFNCILGFSGLQFQVLQPISEAKKGRGKGYANDDAAVQGPEHKALGLKERLKGNGPRRHGDDADEMHGDVDLKKHGGRSEGFFD